MASRRGGFLSRCSRFGVGIGTLSVSRGYGPVSDELIEVEPPPILHAGGPSVAKVITKRKPAPYASTKVGARKKKG